MAVEWLPLLSAMVGLLLATSAFERPIKRALKSRWPAFDYNTQSLLTWGIVSLGTVTMLIFLVLALERL